MRITQPYKKSFFLSFFILLLIFPVEYSIAKSSKATIGVTTHYDVRGTFIVTIYAKNISNMASGQVKLDFDTKNVSVRNVTQGDMISNLLYVDNRDSEKSFKTINNKGEVQAAWASSTGISGDGNLLSIEFYSSRTSNQSPLDLPKVRIFDENHKEIQTLILHGEITPFPGEEKPSPASAVSKTKDWTIHFSSPIMEESMIEHTIYVLDSKGNKVNTKLTLLSGGKSVKIEPKPSYEKGKYTLMITDQLRSQGNGKLKEAVKMEFTVN